MKIGLVGLPLTGKTTFFNLLTHVRGELSGFSSGKVEANIGVAKIPDNRVDFLAGIYKPRKVTYATIEVTDIRGITREGQAAKLASANQFLESVGQVDALVHVVRIFKNDDVIHTEGAIDPLRDMEMVNMELLFADLAVMESRINRIEAGKKVNKEAYMELEVLKKCRDGLEKEILIHNQDLSDEEKYYLKTFNFLTERPMILLANLDEDQFGSGRYEQKDRLMRYADEKRIPVVDICARTELEISQLEDEDKKLFMEDLGIKETGISRLAAAAYDYLGLISFLTVGEDEVRAWPVKKGTNARAAAGKVHSDIERGFIRAEVVKYGDLKNLGSVHKAKEKGLFRLEGREYIVNDGDIINFRFNV